MTKTNGPQPLYDIDVERALISAGLKHNPVFTQTSIDPNAFWDEGLREAWVACKKMVEDGEPVTFLTMPADLRDGIGGIEAQVELEWSPLFDNSPTHAPQFARTLHTLKQRRVMQEVARLNVLASNADDDATRERLLTEAQELTESWRAPLLSEGWKIHPLTVAFEERPPLEYLVEDLITTASLSIIYGAAGSLKSMLVADLAMSVASGTPWLPAGPNNLGCSPRQCVQVPVLWVDFDNGSRRTKERVEALARARGLDPETTPFYFVSMPTPWLDASNEGAMQALTELIEEHNIGLVVFDNLGTVSGGKDENSAEMIQVLGNFRRLVEDTYAAVIIIHHERKHSNGNARAGERLRGFSGIEAALDLALLVERSEGSPSVTCKSTKTRDIDVKPFGATFCYDWKDGTRELSAAKFTGYRVESNSVASRARGAIFEALADAQEPLNNKTLVTNAQDLSCDDKGKPVGAVALRKAIKGMVQADEIDNYQGTGTAQMYQLKVEADG